jgi:glucose-6-phosphate 1-dehydrogenase
MDPPTTLEARSIVEETGKVFQSVSHIDPAHVIRSQYASYHESPGVDAVSHTETFIAPPWGRLR